MSSAMQSEWRDHSNLCGSFEQTIVEDLLRGRWVSTDKRPISGAITGLVAGCGSICVNANRIYGR